MGNRAYGKKLFYLPVNGTEPYEKVINPGSIVEEAFFSGNAECNCQNVLLTLN